MCDKLSLTFSSAILIPLLNLRCTSKEEMELVRRTFTRGLVTTVTPPSMMLVESAKTENKGKQCDMLANRSQIDPTVVYKYC